MAEAQKAGGICAFIDAEHALDPEYARKLGVDTENLYVSQPDNGEQALEIAEELARSGAIASIVVDSVAALVPRAEIEGDMGDSHVGLQARLMSQGLRKLAGMVSRTGTVLIFINQLREKIGDKYGSGETTTGGHALKFYASVRLDIRRSSIKGGKNNNETIGQKANIRVVKNKVSPPFKSTSLEIISGGGFDNVGAIITLAVEQDLIQKSGAWFYYGEQKAHGQSGIRKLFIDQPELLEKVKEELSRQKIVGEELHAVIQEEEIKENCVEMASDEEQQYGVRNDDKIDNIDQDFDFDDLLVAAER